MKEITKDSPESMYEPGAVGLFSTYRYIVEFNINNSILKGTFFEIYINGKYRLIDQPVLYFDSVHKLNIKEVYEMFEGTTGIKKITGDFKNS